MCSVDKWGEKRSVINNFSGDMGVVGDWSQKFINARCLRVRGFGPPARVVLEPVIKSATNSHSYRAWHHVREIEIALQNITNDDLLTFDERAAVMQLSVDLWKIQQREIQSLDDDL